MKAKKSQVRNFQIITLLIVGALAIFASGYYLGSYQAWTQYAAGLQ